MINRDVVVGDIVIDGDFNDKISCWNKGFNIFRVVETPTTENGMYFCCVLIMDGYVKMAQVKMFKKPKKIHKISVHNMQECYFLCTREIIERRMAFDALPYAPLLELIDGANP